MRLLRFAWCVATMLLLAQAVGAETPPPSPAQSAPPSTAGQAPLGPMSYAQYLVDSTASRHPELSVVDVHVVPPGGARSTIIASRSPERIGQLSDADEIDVERSGVPRVAINRRGDQNVSVELVLLDIYNQPIGMVEFAFPYPPGTDEDALIKKSAQYRDEMSRRILDASSLADPLQLDPRIPTHTYAQYLIDDTLGRHPEIEIITFHAAGPEGVGGYPIVASNIGRIGKPADESDLEVITTGKAHGAADAKGRRYEAKLPLQDAGGKTIGALAVVFPYRRLSIASLLQEEATEIAASLSARISGVQQLYGPYPSLQPIEAAPAIEEYNRQELGNKQDLPMTKAVVSGEALQQSTQEGYSEAIRNVAGVSATNSKGSANDAFSIRGIKLNLFSNYRLNGGLPIAGVITTPTENKERLETLKGANALMFGVASPAGIINLVTKRAGPRDVNSVGFAGNSFGQYGALADVGRRFGEERQFGLRVNASATHLENGVKNLGGHGDFASVGADWRVTDRLSFQGDFEHYTKHVPEQASIALLPAVNGIVPITPVPNPRNLLSGTWAVYTPKTSNYQGRVDYAFTDDWHALAEYGRSESNRSRFTTRIGNYDLVTGAGGVVTVQPVTNAYVNSFHRFELLGRFKTWSLTHDLTVGYSSTERDTNTTGQNNVTLPQKQNIFDPIVLAPPVFTKPFTSLPTQVSRDNGLYVYDTVSVLPQLRLLAGVRWTQDLELNGFTASTTYLASPAYGILYDIRPATTLFASYMEGLEAGATAPATAANPNVILPPAVSKQKEIGLRDSYFKGLSISASYFEITRANAVTDPVSNIFEYNGNLDYTGVEATMAYDISSAWSVTAAGQWLKAVQNSPLQPLINGRVPENTPKWIGNATLTWRVLQVPGLSLNVGTSLISARPVNPQDQGNIPGYATYSAGAGYVTRLRGVRATFQLSVDNLSNLRYWNSVQTGTYGIGMDRSFRFSAKIDF